jgi:hypothetical protein
VTRILDSYISIEGKDNIKMVGEWRDMTKNDGKVKRWIEDDLSQQVDWYKEMKFRYTMTEFKDVYRRATIKRSKKGKYVLGYQTNLTQLKLDKEYDVLFHLNIPPMSSVVNDIGYQVIFPFDYFNKFAEQNGNTSFSLMVQGHLARLRKDATDSLYRTVQEAASRTDYEPLRYFLNMEAMIKSSKDVAINLIKEFMVIRNMFFQRRTNSQWYLSPDRDDLAKAIFKYNYIRI